MPQKSRQNSTGFLGIENKWNGQTSFSIIHNVCLKCRQHTKCYTIYKGTNTNRDSRKPKHCTSYLVPHTVYGIAIFATYPNIQLYKLKYKGQNWLFSRYLNFCDVSPYFSTSLSIINKTGAFTKCENINLLWKKYTVILQVFSKKPLFHHNMNFNICVIKPTGQAQQIP